MMRVSAILALPEDIARPRTELSQPIHHVAASLPVIEQGKRGKRRQLPRSLEFLLHVAVRTPGCQTPAAEHRDERRLECRAAEAWHDPAQDSHGKFRRVNQRERIFDMRLDGIERGPDFHDGLRTASDAQNRALDG